MQIYLGTTEAVAQTGKGKGRGKRSRPTECVEQDMSAVPGPSTVPDPFPGSSTGMLNPLYNKEGLRVIPDTQEPEYD